MRKYIFSLILIFSLCCEMAFGQELVESKKKNLFGKKYEKPSSVKDFFHQVDMSIKLGTTTYINSLDEKTSAISAPSPIVFMPGIGVIWPNFTFIAVEPTLYFYYSYYQWANGMAVPAEIENRTATTLSFMIDVPVVFSFFLKKSKIQAGIGPAALLRFAFLSGGVKETDYGFSGNAANDVSLINSYFWDKARFLYLSVSAAWLFNFYKNSKAGPFAKMYLPIGSQIADEGINGMIVSIGLKVSF